MEWLIWFTKWENTKPLSMVLFLFSFVFILWYVFGSRKRSDRLESYKNMPFHED
jgi:cbb3-type cytochrome oxidase subunit 3